MALAVRHRSDRRFRSLPENIMCIWAIKTAMSDLKPKHKEIAVMYFKQNLKYTEIANILEIPLNNVKITIFRIREALQSSLKKEYQLLHE